MITGCKWLGFRWYCCSPPDWLLCCYRRFSIKQMRNIFFILLLDYESLPIRNLLDLHRMNLFHRAANFHYLGGESVDGFLKFIQKLIRFANLSLNRNWKLVVLFLTAVKVRKWELGKRRALYRVNASRVTLTEKCLRWRKIGVHVNFFDVFAGCCLAVNCR